MSLIKFERDEIEGTIGGRLSRVAAAFPGGTAVRLQDSSLTFGELDRASTELADRILDRRGPSPEPAALLFDLGAESMQAFFGILRAGKSAVVLAPDFPAGRLREIWIDAGKPLIVTGPAHRSLAADIAGSPDAILDLHGAPDGTPRPESPVIRPETPALILYTSGSTGEPKGVVLSHRTLLHGAWDYFRRYRLSGVHRLALVASQGYGASSTHSMYPLLAGASLHFLAGDDQRLDRLVDSLRREKITKLVMPSFALLQQQMDAMTARVSLPDLLSVVISGSELRRTDLQRFRDFFPERIEFFFRLASSEVLLMSEMRIAPGDPLPWEKIPVGRAIPDKELMILDDQRRPVPPGAVGEIAVRSRYLADGYLHNPELTAAKFLPDPKGGGRRIFLTGDLGRRLPDGLLEHVGRKDNVVRIRGVSVQLETVVKALEDLPEIREAAAAAVPFRGGAARLAAYVVPSGGGKPTVSDLRRRLTAVLPPPMIPSVFVFLDSLPRTPGNRVDRAALPPPEAGRPDMGTPLTAPRDDVERRLVRLWSDITGVDPVGIDDDFFLLGGDSLTALHMALTVEEILHWQVPSAFFRVPTIRRLTELWKKNGRGGKDVSAGIPSAEKLPAAEGADGEDDEVSVAPRIRGRKTGKPEAKDRIDRRILNRIRRELAFPVPDLAMRLSYLQGIRLLAWWSSRPWVAGLLYPDEREVFLRFTEDLGARLEAPAGAFGISLMGNLIWGSHLKIHRMFQQARDPITLLKESPFRFWHEWGTILDDASPAELERYGSLSGLSHLEQAYRLGRGVILVTYHSSVIRFVDETIARRLGAPRIPTISYRRALKEAGIIGEMNEAAIPDVPSDRIAAASADLVLRGQRWLKEGRIVQVVPDSVIDPDGTMPVTVGKRIYRWKAGFAELALIGGAPVIPIGSTRRSDGYILGTVHPALDSGSEGENREDRIYRLLKQYGAFVEQAWRSAPESLKWGVIQRHLQQPYADPALSPQIPAGFQK
jgi:acyl-coenzyme A synthetase/AMP-(fatty) acid ligase/lauroyl/myristoyl acyltransferase